MKKIIIAVLALVLLIGGGAGAYFTLLAKPAEASTGEDSTQHAEVKKEEHEEVHFEFVELDPLILPIVGDDGLSQTVSLVVVLEVFNAEAAHSVEQMTPRIKDAFIQDLYGTLNRHAALKGGVIQVDYLKQRLNKVSQKVMGDGLVNDVLLQVVQQRPI